MNAIKSLLTRHAYMAKKSVKNNYDLYLLILPVLVWYILFCYWPMYGVQIAFKDFNPGLGVTNSPWVGMKHFFRFFNGNFFWRLIGNTIGISGYSLLVGLPTPIILAVLFNELRSKKFKTTAQTISYAPYFLSIVVIVSLIFRFLGSKDSIVNAALGYLGFEPVKFMSDPKYFWHIYVWTGVWQGIGFSSVLYTAAISGIPTEQYESARIDGATRLRRIWYITIPNILPTIVIVTILSAGGIMNVGFEKIFLMQNTLNIEKSEVISTYVYKVGLQSAQFSFSAAVGLFNNVINFFILIATNEIAKRFGETSLW